MIAALTDGLYITLLLFVEGTGDMLGKALRKTKDCVQGGTQLVAHAGQEFILGAQSTLQFGSPFLHPPLELSIQLQDLRLRLFARGDVDLDPLPADGTPLIVSQEHRLVMEPDHAAVPGEHTVLHAGGLTCAPALLHGMEDSRAIIRMQPG